MTGPSSHRHDLWLMSAGPDEGHEVLRADGGGRRVLQRMIVYQLMGHHGSVQHNVDALFRVVDQAEGGNGTRFDPKNFPLSRDE